VDLGSKHSEGQTANAPFFGALDGFRGLLALFVAIYHTFWFTNINSSAFFNHGPVIIDLFFVFSGFLLYTLYADRIKSGKDGLKFIKRRFARLYPLHLFILGLFVVFAGLRVFFHAIGVAHHDPGEILPFQSGAQESLSTLVSNLTLTHAMGIHDHTSFNVPSWTISVEFFAYFTLAALLIWKPLRKFWHFGAVGVAIGAIYWILSTLKPNMDITYDYAFLRCIAGFYTGVVVAGVYAWIKSKAIDEKIGFGFGSLIEIAALAGSTIFVIYCPGKLQFFVAPVLFVFVLVFAFDKGIVSRFMMQGFFRYLAKISYSVYMMHMLISVFFYAFATFVVARFLGERWFESGILGDLYLIPYLLCVIVASHLTQKFVEVPGQKYLMKRNLIPGRFRGKQAKASPTKP